MATHSPYDKLIVTDLHPATDTLSRGAKTVDVSTAAESFSAEQDEMDKASAAGGTSSIHVHAINSEDCASRSVVNESDSEGDNILSDEDNTRVATLPNLTFEDNPEDHTLPNSACGINIEGHNLTKLTRVINIEGNISPNRICETSCETRNEEYSSTNHVHIMRSSDLPAVAEEINAQSHTDSDFRNEINSANALNESYEPYHVKQSEDSNHKDNSDLFAEKCSFGNCNDICSVEVLFEDLEKLNMGDNNCVECSEALNCNCESLEVGINKDDLQERSNLRTVTFYSKNCKESEMAIQECSDSITLDYSNVDTCSEITNRMQVKDNFTLNTAFDIPSHATNLMRPNCPKGLSLPHCDIPITEIPESRFDARNIQFSHYPDRGETNSVLNSQSAFNPGLVEVKVEPTTSSSTRPSILTLSLPTRPLVGLNNSGVTQVLSQRPNSLMLSVRACGSTMPVSQDSQPLFSDKHMSVSDNQFEPIFDYQAEFRSNAKHGVDDISEPLCYDQPETLFDSKLGFLTDKNSETLFDDKAEILIEPDSLFNSKFEPLLHDQYNSQCDVNQETLWNDKSKDQEYESRSLSDERSMSTSCDQAEHWFNGKTKPVCDGKLELHSDGKSKPLSDEKSKTLWIGKSEPLCDHKQEISSDHKHDLSEYGSYSSSDRRSYDILDSTDGDLALNLKNKVSHNVNELYGVAHRLNSGERLTAGSVASEHNHGISHDLSGHTSARPLTLNTECAALPVISVHAIDAVSRTDSPDDTSDSLATTPVIEPLTPPLCGNINLYVTDLGTVAPVWLPDSSTQYCMNCIVRFTFTKRRHHCRACGKIFCSVCCNVRAKLRYMEPNEGRVCSKCHQDLIRAKFYQPPTSAAYQRLNAPSTQQARATTGRAVVHRATDLKNLKQTTAVNVRCDQRASEETYQPLIASDAVFNANTSTDNVPFDACEAATASKALAAGLTGNAIDAAAVNIIATTACLTITTTNSSSTTMAPSFTDTVSSTSTMPTAIYAFSNLSHSVSSQNTACAVDINYLRNIQASAAEPDDSAVYVVASAAANRVTAGCTTVTTDDLVTPACSAVDTISTTAVATCATYPAAHTVDTNTGLSLYARSNTTYISTATKSTITGDSLLTTTKEIANVSETILPANQPCDGELITVPASLEVATGDGTSTNTRLHSHSDAIAEFNGSLVTPGNSVNIRLNSCLYVSVSKIFLSCCINEMVWVYVTHGMCTVGQHEIILLLKCEDQESSTPDILTHLQDIYNLITEGKPLQAFDHYLFQQADSSSDLGDYAGLVFFQPTFQCLDLLPLPHTPHMFGLLVHRLELPWVRSLPLRLLLRLGAGYRYYPCPLVSPSHRAPVYTEVGHTIVSLLADMRDFRYRMSPRVEGLTISIRELRSIINIPQHSHKQMLQIISDMTDHHVLGLEADFNMAADSHLVCKQIPDGRYLTEAINIQYKPRMLTGASFVVFNAALKSLSTEQKRCRCSIVEDGLMVQLCPRSFKELKQAVVEMRDFSLLCSEEDDFEFVSSAEGDARNVSEQLLMIEWTDDQCVINKGVKSPVDDQSMSGIESRYIHSTPDYFSSELIIRWTQTFYTSGCLHRFVEEKLAQTCCMTLIPHLESLRAEILCSSDPVLSEIRAPVRMWRIGVRLSVQQYQVSYEIGYGGRKLSKQCLKEMENKVLAILSTQGGSVTDVPSPDGSDYFIFEFIFYLIEQ